MSEEEKLKLVLEDLVKEMHSHYLRYREEIAVYEVTESIQFYLEERKVNVKIEGLEE